MNPIISLTSLSDKTVWETVWLTSSRLKEVLKLIVERNKGDEWTVHWLENIPTTTISPNIVAPTTQTTTEQLLDIDLQQIQEEDFNSIQEEDEDETRADEASKSSSSIATASSEDDEEVEEQIDEIDEVQSKPATSLIDSNKTTAEPQGPRSKHQRGKEKKSEYSQLRIANPPMVTLIFISDIDSKAFLIHLPILFFATTTVRTLRSLQVNPSSNKIVCVGCSTGQWIQSTNHRLTRASSIEEGVSYFLQAAVMDLYQVVCSEPMSMNRSWGYPSITLVPNPSHSLSTTTKPPRFILVILLRSGRFAMALLDAHTCIQSPHRVIQDFVVYHTTSTRYTTRRGQGGAQSTKDTQKSIKSVGSQLRRMGEVQLRQDVRTAFQEMYKAIKRPDLYAEDSSVVDLLNQCQFVFWGVSKNLLSSFWEDANTGLGNKNFKGNTKDQDDFHHLFHSKNTKMKSIPLDYGRPSYQACCVIFERLMMGHIQDPVQENWISSLKLTQTSAKADGNNKKNENRAERISSSVGADANTARVAKSIDIPLNPFHEAARDCDWKRLMQLLELHSIEDLGDEDDDDGEVKKEKSHGSMYDINAKAGPNLMTPLHYASSAISLDSQVIDPNDAAKCISILLEQGGADPSIRDLHDCLPYSIASQDSIRTAFRQSRGNIGENTNFDWDKDAKVGPPITDESLQMKKQKAMDKKRRQRQSQKERKIADKQKTETEERLRQEAMERKQKEEEERRVRAGLHPKVVTVTSSNDSVCDFCQTVVKGKRRSQLFSRLEFAYCSMDCVKKHQRELTAAAALSRASSTS